VLVVRVRGGFELERRVLAVEVPGDALLQLVEQLRGVPVVWSRTTRRSTLLGLVSSRMSTASRSSRQVRGRMSTPMASETIASAWTNPVSWMTSAASSTPTELNASAATSRKAPRVVIPEGGGPVKPSGLGVLVTFFWISGAVEGRRRRGAGVKVERPQGEARGRTTLTPAPSGADFVCPGESGVVGAAFSSVRCGQAAVPGGPVAGHPFATGRGWHGVLRRQPGGVNQITSTASPVGGSDHPRPRVWLRRAGVHAGRVRARMCPSRSP